MEHMLSVVLNVSMIMIVSFATILTATAVVVLIIFLIKLLVEKDD